MQQQQQQVQQQEHLQQQHLQHMHQQQHLQQQQQEAQYLGYAGYSMYAAPVQQQQQEAYAQYPLTSHYSEPLGGQWHQQSPQSAAPQQYSGRQQVLQSSPIMSARKASEQQPQPYEQAYAPPAYAAQYQQFPHYALQSSSPPPSSQQQEQQQQRQEPSPPQPRPPPQQLQQQQQQQQRQQQSPPQQQRQQTSAAPHQQAQSPQQLQQQAPSQPQRGGLGVPRRESAVAATLDGMEPAPTRPKSMSLPSMPPPLPVAVGAPKAQASASSQASPGTPPFSSRSKSSAQHTQQAVPGKKQDVPLPASASPSQAKQTPAPPSPSAPSTSAPGAGAQSGIAIAQLQQQQQVPRQEPVKTPGGTAKATAAPKPESPPPPPPPQQHKQDAGASPATPSGSSPPQAKAKAEPKPAEASKAQPKLAQAHATPALHTSPAQQPVQEQALPGPASESAALGGADELPAVSRTSTAGSHGSASSGDGGSESPVKRLSPGSAPASSHKPVQSQHPHSHPHSHSLAGLEKHAGGLVTLGQHHKKRHACDGCYRSRVKCEFLHDEQQCVRCTRQKRECVPRIIIRHATPAAGGGAGGPLGLYVREPSSGSLSGEMLAQRRISLGSSGASSVDGGAHAMARPAPPSAAQPKGTAQARAFVAAPRTPERSLDDVSQSAARSVDIFEDLQEQELQLSAARSLVRTYTSLGLKHSPLSLQWTINSMYLIANVERSMSLLQTLNTLAASTNTPISALILDREHCPISEEDTLILEQQVHADFLDDRGSGACFILRTEGSDRAILANEEFEFFFESAVSMAARLLRAPHYRLWRRFLGDDADAVRFTGEMVKAWLMAGDPAGQPAAIRWSCSDHGLSRVRDSDGNEYQARMYEFGLLAGDGFLGMLVFGFKEMVPLSAKGRARLAAFRKQHPAHLKPPAPSLTRLQSPGWNAMLPDAMLPEPSGFGLAGPGAALQQQYGYEPYQQNMPYGDYSEQTQGQANGIDNMAFDYGYLAGAPQPGAQPPVGYYDTLMMPDGEAYGNPYDAFDTYHSNAAVLQAQGTHDSTLVSMDNDEWKASINSCSSSSSSSSSSVGGRRSSNSSSPIAEGEAEQGEGEDGGEVGSADDLDAMKGNDADWQQ